MHLLSSDRDFKQHIPIIHNDNFEQKGNILTSDAIFDALFPISMREANIPIEHMPVCIETVQTCVIRFHKEKTFADEPDENLKKFFEENNIDTSAGQIVSHRLQSLDEKQREKPLIECDVFPISNFFDVFTIFTQFDEYKVDKPIVLIVRMLKFLIFEDKLAKSKIKELVTIIKSDTVPNSLQSLISFLIMVLTLNHSSIEPEKEQRIFVKLVFALDNIVANIEQLERYNIFNNDIMNAIIDIIESTECNALKELKIRLERDYLYPIFGDDSARGSDSLTAVKTLNAAYKLCSDNCLIHVNNTLSVIYDSSLKGPANLSFTSNLATALAFVGFPNLDITVYNAQRVFLDNVVSPHILLHGVQKIDIIQSTITGDVIIRDVNFNYDVDIQSNRIEISDCLFTKFVQFIASDAMHASIKHTSFHYLIFVGRATPTDADTWELEIVDVDVELISLRNLTTEHSFFNAFKAETFEILHAKVHEVFTDSTFTNVVISSSKATIDLIVTDIGKESQLFSNPNVILSVFDSTLTLNVTSLGDIGNEEGFVQTSYYIALHYNDAFFKIFSPNIRVGISFYPLHETSRVCFRASNLLELGFPSIELPKEYIFHSFFVENADISFSNTLHHTMYVETTLQILNSQISNTGSFILAAITPGIKSIFIMDNCTVPDVGIVAFSQVSILSSYVVSFNGNNLHNVLFQNTDFSSILLTNSTDLIIKDSDIGVMTTLVGHRVHVSSNTVIVSVSFDRITTISIFESELNSLNVQYATFLVVENTHFIKNVNDPKVTVSSINVEFEKLHIGAPTKFQMISNALGVQNTVFNEHTVTFDVVCSRMFLTDVIIKNVDSIYPFMIFGRLSDASVSVASVEMTNVTISDSSFTTKFIEPITTEILYDSTIIERSIINIGSLGTKCDVKIFDSTLTHRIFTDSGVLSYYKLEMINVTSQDFIFDVSMDSSSSLELYFIESIFDLIFAKGFICTYGVSILFESSNFTNCYFMKGLIHESIETDTDSISMSFSSTYIDVKGTYSALVNSQRAAIIFDSCIVHSELLSKTAAHIVVNMHSSVILRDTIWIIGGTKHSYGIIGSTTHIKVVRSTVKVKNNQLVSFSFSTTKTLLVIDQEFNYIGSQTLIHSSFILISSVNESESKLDVFFNTSITIKPLVIANNLTIDNVTLAVNDMSHFSCHTNTITTLPCTPPTADHFIDFNIVFLPIVRPRIFKKETSLKFQIVSTSPSKHPEISYFKQFHITQRMIEHTLFMRVNGDIATFQQTLYRSDIFEVSLQKSYTIHEDIKIELFLPYINGSVIYRHLKVPGCPAGTYLNGLSCLPCQSGTIQLQDDFVGTSCVEDPTFHLLSSSQLNYVTGSHYAVQSGKYIFENKNNSINSMINCPRGLFCSASTIQMDARFHMRESYVWIAPNMFYWEESMVKLNSTKSCPMVHLENA
ncbi:hypothetical protein PCE1_003095 [Barthelona sp. PCE]